MVYHARIHNGDGFKTGVWMGRKDGHTGFAVIHIVWPCCHCTFKRAHVGVAFWEMVKVVGGKEKWVFEVEFEANGNTGINHGRSHVFAPYIWMWRNTVWTASSV